MRRLVVLGLSILFIVILNTPTILSLNTTSMHNQKDDSFTVSQEYHTQHDQIVITQTADFVQHGFPGSGTYEDPYIIERLAIDDYYGCIQITGTHYFFTIRDCILRSNYHEVIHLENVTNGKIEDCLIEEGEFGILLRGCNSIDIIGNTMAGSRPAGVYVQYCNYDIVISDNKIFGCETGIFGENSEFCIITMNRIYGNRFGIHLLEDTQSYVIGHNSFGWNDNRNNRFHDNIDGANAFDDGSDNSWDGNRWSDYRSQHLWYEVQGNTGAQDSNPSLLSDLFAPSINVTETEIETTDNVKTSLTWTFAEEFPYWYNLYQEGEIIDNGYLIQDVIAYPLGSLPNGYYNFTILLRDGAGNIGTLQHTIRVGPLVEPFVLFSVGIILGTSVILIGDYLRWNRKRERIEESENEAYEEPEFDISELLD